MLCLHIVYKRSSRLSLSKNTLNRDKRPFHLYIPILAGLWRRKGSLFPFFPEFTHVFQCFTFRFRYPTPYKDGSNYTDNSVKAVCEHRTEIVERRESRRYNVIEYPLECYGNGNRFAANRIREYFCNKYPADWSPWHHKECRNIP